MKQVESLYPLSPMQEGMLYHSLSEPGAGMYVTQLAWRIGLPPGGGELDLDLFQAAWSRAVAANGVLRTSVVWKKVDDPIQVVHRSVELPFHYADLRGEPRERRLERLESESRELRYRGFDLARPPLFDLRVWRLSDDEYRFGFTFHHIILDGWSVILLLQEVMGTYVALATRREPRTAARRPFRDYIVWLNRVGMDEGERFWRRELEGLDRPTPLSVDRPSDPAADAPGRLARRSLSSADTARLAAFAPAHRVTPFTLAQAAWALVLSRYSGDRKVVFGAVTLGRPPDLEGSEAMVGLFVNTLPVVVDVGGDEEAGAWLRAIQLRQLEARQYEFCPLRSIREWSGFERGQPLMESLVVSSGYGRGAVGEAGARSGNGSETGTGAGAEGSPLEVEHLTGDEQSSYPLALEASGEERLRLIARYDGRRFDEATVDRLLGHVETAILDLADGRRPRDVSILRPGEREQLVRTWATGTRGEPGADLVHRQFAEQAARRPDAVAIVAGEETLTYGEVVRRVKRLAARFTAAGVGTDDRVAVALERSPWVAISWLAALEAGGAYLPIDPEHPPARVAAIFETARPAALVAEAQTFAAWPELAVARVEVGAAALSEVDDGAAGSPARAWPQSLAHVIFTSGSTGVPKGSMNSHRAVLGHVVSRVERFDLGPGDAVLQRMPTVFDPSIAEMAVPLLTGARLVVAPPGSDREPARLAREIARQRVVFLDIVPSLYRVLLDHADPDDLRGLRVVVCGGEALDADLVRRTRELLPGLRLNNHYGPTEATVDATAWTAPEDDVTGRPPPIGRPVSDTRVLLLDRELRPVPVGVPGEIAIGGAGLARGYLGRPGETGARFVPDPFAAADDPDRPPGGRLYRTGDLARWNEAGEIEFAGRADHQVKVRGFRIELGEIEAVARSCHEVGEAVARVREDDGVSGSIVVFLVPAEGAGASPEAAEARDRAVDARFAETLPAYMRPSAQVWLDALPRLASGKLDRAALAGHLPSNGVPRETIAPRNDTERRLVAIWSTVLRQDPVSVDDDFFDLGGHSLLAFRLVARINQEFEVALPMSTLLTGPATPERLAVELLERSVSLGWNPLVRLADGDRPPFFCVHPIGGQVFGFRALARSMAEGQPFYGLQAPGLEDYDEAKDLTVSIEDMAAHYVRAIREEYPDGPYFLGGMSFGATVAFEMAQQLQRAGRTVGLVALLDSPAPIADEGVEGADYSGVIAAACQEFAHQMGGSIELEVADLQGRERDDQLTHVLGLLQAEKLVSSEIDVPMMRRFIDGHQARLTASVRYQGGRYPGPLHLFHAATRHGEILVDLPDELRRVFQDPELGWGDFTSHGVIVHEFDAFHETLLREPSVRDVAERLQSLIDEFSGSRTRITQITTPLGDSP